MKHRLETAISLFICFCAVAVAAASEPTPRASQAWDAYVTEARQTFLERVATNADARSDGGAAPPARPGREDGIVSVPDGLIHHWVGGAFIPYVTLQRAVEVSRAYDAYSSIYKEVVASKLVAHHGDTYQVLIRLKEGEAGISAVLDIHSRVQYFRPTDRITYSISNAEQIYEVKNAGQKDEQILPAGEGRGFLWRTTSFTRFTERDTGVYVEMETLGLSRGFPRFLGWFIEPIARRLGRKSIERSLEEFTAAVRNEESNVGLTEP